MEISEKKNAWWKIIFEKIACSYKFVTSLEMNVTFLSLQEQLINIKLRKDYL